MLVLFRSKSQAVVMPELGIKVTILKTTGGRVKLGFEAPRNLRIIREEHHVQEESAPNLAETRGEPDCSDAGGQSVEQWLASAKRPLVAYSTGKSGANSRR